MIRLEGALDPEKNTISITMHDIPIEFLNEILTNISEPEWRQNVVDGVNGAVAARELGIVSTKRTFSVPSQENNE